MNHRRPTSILPAPQGAAEHLGVVAGFAIGGWCLLYALDILAWDVFFPLGTFFAAWSIPAESRAGGVRSLLFASAALAVLGLIGVPLADMRVRNVGIFGYVVAFPLATVRFARILRQPAGEDRDHGN